MAGLTKKELLAPAFEPVNQKIVTLCLLTISMVFIKTLKVELAHG